MAAAALTTEDIRTALGIRHPGLPTSLECIYHPEFPDLVDIVEEEDDDDDDDEEEDDEDDVDDHVDDDDDEDVDIDGDDNAINERHDTNDNDCRKNVIPSSNVNCDARSINCPCFSNDNSEYDEIADNQNKDNECQERNDRVVWDMAFNQSENVLIKEVTLCRKTSDEKFGLTLCYRQGDICNTSCNVYVGENLKCKNFIDSHVCLLNVFLHDKSMQLTIYAS
ncbi:unnamed protein product [Schistosoma turkestanicum]|nr:unnamed protein product [Schistosoma turkestanicum]